MIAAIAQGELVAAWHDGRLRGSLILFSLLLIASGMITAAVAQHDRDRRDAAERTVYEQWLAQQEKHPHGAAHFGFYVFKPDSPLALLDQGVKPWVGVALWLDTHRRNTFQYRPSDDASPAQRYGMLTPAVVLGIIAPLLVILCGFGAITAERERGTLRLLLMCGVTPVRLALGKVMGLAGIIGVSCLPAAIVLTLLVLAASEASDLTTTALSLGAWWMFHLAHLMVWVLVTIGVSARCHSTTASLGILLALWVVSLVVAPRAASALARHQAPPQDLASVTAAIEQRQRTDEQGDGAVERWWEDLTRRTLQEHGVERLEDLPVGFAGIMLRDGEKRTDRLYAEAFAEVYARHDAQERWRLGGALLSPWQAVRPLTQAVAGMDGTDFRHFADTAEAHRRELNRWLNDHAERHGHGDGWDLRVGREFFATAPVYTYQPPTLLDILSRQPAGSLIVACWLLIATWFALRWPLRAQEA
jgi:ABC-2 type transport system permease protein